ncbi:MAG: hypothetical protein QME70_09535 [Bacillota bacterium]|nr:hypothetical protein [Bacillota bacterium]
MFGVRVGERVYFNEPVADSTLGSGAVLLRKEVAEAAKRTEAREVASVEVSNGSPSVRKEGSAGAITVPSTTPPGVAVSGVHLRAKVPWDKLADFVREVVLPLRSDGANLQVEVLVEARCESGGIKVSTLQQKVRETLQQIGAQVLEEQVE